MKRYISILTLLGLILPSCSEALPSSSTNAEDLILEPIAYIHNSVLSKMLSYRTKSATIEDRSSYEHALFVSELACDAASEIGIEIAPNEIIDLVRTEQIIFFETLGAEHFMTPILYIDKLPYEESVKLKLKELYIKDLKEGTSALENYLFQLANSSTKSYDGYSQYSYESLYNFYKSDARIWDNYYATKGDDRARHVIAVATDVIVGAACSGMTGFLGAVAAGAIGALASEVMANGEINPDSTTD